MTDTPTNRPIRKACQRCGQRDAIEGRRVCGSCLADQVHRKIEVYALLSLLSGISWVLSVAWLAYMASKYLGFLQ